MLVIYFHGFASSPKTEKVDILKRAGFKVIAPKIDVDPDVADKELTAFIKAELVKDMHSAQPTKMVAFIGTSLGGFWAARMSEKFDCPCLLINPAMHPEETLKQFIGEHKSYDDGKKFQLTAKIVEAYKKYSSAGESRLRTYFAAMNDAVVKDLDKIDKDSVVKKFDSDDHRGMTIFPHVITHLKSMKR